MKYVVIFLVSALVVMGTISYYYYDASQETIKILTDNNATLEVAVGLNEKAIDDLTESYAEVTEKTAMLYQENIILKRQNQILVDKFRDNDIGLIASVKPELIEKLINKGSKNAFRCFEILSGAELTTAERNAKNEKEFNNECPWLFSTVNDP